MLDGPERTRGQDRLKTPSRITGIAQIKNIGDDHTIHFSSFSQQGVLCRTLFYVKRKVRICACQLDGQNRQQSSCEDWSGCRCAETPLTSWQIDGSSKSSNSQLKTRCHPSQSISYASFWIMSIKQTSSPYACSIKSAVLAHRVFSIAT
jgi:hypothetical protein